MRKLEGLSLTAALAMAAALTSCDDPQAVRVCVGDDGRRIADASCDDTSNAVRSATRWRYYGAGQTAPALGAAATGGSDVEDHSVSYEAAPDEGGISRGGFGEGGESHGGGEGGHGGGGE